MDAGTWTFKCRKCGASFELPLTERQRAADIAREKPCPSCGGAPKDVTESESMRGENWHQVIGFRMENKRPFIV
jgi:Zn finger protein HypA/HybF involved in hydrogenase expression